MLIWCVLLLLRCKGFGVQILPANLEDKWPGERDAALVLTLELQCIVVARKSVECKMVPW